MSVLIKGFDMPKRCRDCRFLRSKYPYPYYCFVQGFPIKPKEIDSRDEECPLVEVKEMNGEGSDD